MSAEIKKIKDGITCFCLKVWMAVRRKPLRLYVLSGPEVIVFNDNPVTMRWTVTGCYKIVINQRILVPGHITQVQLQAGSFSEMIDVCFFGIGQSIRRCFIIHIAYIRLKAGAELILPSFEPPVLSVQPRPELSCITTLKALQLQQPLISRPAQLQLPYVFLPPKPLLQVPMLHMQLTSYPLQPTQPDYETTVL